MERIEYKTNEERDELLQQKEAGGLLLIEVQDHEDGNFLVFDSAFPTPPVDKVAVLEAQVEQLIQDLKNKGVL